MEWRTIPLEPEYEISKDKEIRHKTTGNVITICPSGINPKYKYATVGKGHYNIDFLYNISFFDETPDWKFVPGSNYKYTITKDGDMYNMAKWHKYSFFKTRTGERQINHFEHTIEWYIKATFKGEIYRQIRDSEYYVSEKGKVFNLFTRKFRSHRGLYVKGKGYNTEKIIEEAFSSNTKDWTLDELRSFEFLREGYERIPLTTHYIISREGIVVDTHNNKELKYNECNKIFSIVNKNNKRKHILKTVLMDATFGEGKVKDDALIKLRDKLDEIDIEQYKHNEVIDFKTMEDVHMIKVERDSGLIEMFTLEEFKQLCGNDDKMTADYIKHIISNPRSKYSNGTWFIE